jgi:hypothetical protein
MSFTDPVGIIFFGGVKINALENTSSFNVGDFLLQSLNSQVKNNIVNGQIYGDFDYNLLNPVASPLYDPDGTDTFMPLVMSSLGLDD